MCACLDTALPLLNDSGLIEAGETIGTVTDRRIGLPLLNDSGLIEATAFSA